MERGAWDCLPGERACWARWHCGKQFGESRCEADILLPCHLVPTRQLSWEAKKKSRDNHPFQLVGVSRRWVTASTLVGGTGSHQPTCGYPESFLFSLLFSPCCFFVTTSGCAVGKGCPTHTFPASQGRCDTGAHGKRGDLLTHLHFPKGLHPLWICLSQIQGT